MDASRLVNQLQLEPSQPPPNATQLYIKAQPLIQQRKNSRQLEIYFSPLSEAETARIGLLKPPVKSKNVTAGHVKKATTRVFMGFDERSHPKYVLAKVASLAPWLAAWERNLDPHTRNKVGNKIRQQQIDEGLAIGDPETVAFNPMFKQHLKAG